MFTKKGTMHSITPLNIQNDTRGLMKNIFYIIILICCFVVSASARMYFWVDKNGVKHFSNNGAQEGTAHSTMVESQGESVDDVFFENGAFSDDEIQQRRAEREKEIKAWEGQRVNKERRAEASRSGNAPIIVNPAPSGSSVQDLIQEQRIDRVEHKVRDMEFESYKVK